MNELKIKKMRKLHCLTEQAIKLMKTPHVKWQIMYALDINDPRTMEKHLQNNFPNGPLMNFNVREILKEATQYLTDKDIYHKLTEEEIEALEMKRMKLQQKNAKYNSKKQLPKE